MNQCEQGQCPTKHEWCDVGDGDDKNSAQMTDDERDDVKDSQSPAGGDVSQSTELLQHASVTCHKTGKISSLCQCRYVVR